MARNKKVVPGLICEGDLANVREAVCVTVEKVYDSCRDKDCIENARVYFRSRNIDSLIRRAINVKVRRAEIMDIYADVEEVPFKRGFYTVDVKYFIVVTLDFFVPAQNGGTRIITVPGLVTFDKKVILFGSEGNVKIFKSYYTQYGIDNPLRSKLSQDNLPISLVEAAEPIALNANIVSLCNCECSCSCNCFDQLPATVADTFDSIFCFDESVLDDFQNDCGPVANEQIVVVSLGIFSIIKLIRNVQLLIPAFDFCVPNKECIAATDESA